ncbi:hypothetical protein H8959_019402 [Pygathrix nigripes]
MSCCFARRRSGGRCRPTAASCRRRLCRTHGASCRRRRGNCGACRRTLSTTFRCWKSGTLSWSAMMPSSPWAREWEEARRAEVSELKIEAAKLRQALARETRKVEELQQQQQLVWQEHRLELERVHSDKNGEIDHHREQYENLKWRLERKLEEFDGELALQRQVKLLHKELEALKEAGAKAAESLQRAEATNAELERKLQSRAAELRDLEAMNCARVKDLEDKLHSVQLTRKKEEETFKRKHEELDHLAREKDAVLVAVKGAHVEQLRELKARVLELQAHCETLEAQLRRAEWRQAHTAKEKDAAIDQLREDVSTVKSAWDAQIAQLSKEMVSKDLQIQTLQEEEVKLKDTGGPIPAGH